MTEDRCAVCGHEIEKDGMCLEVWLRLPEDEETQQALMQASEVVATAFGVKAEVRIHEGYVTPAEYLCSFSCLAQYAYTRWQQAEMIRSAARLTSFAHEEEWHGNN
jgi:hypothetical protein